MTWAASGIKVTQPVKVKVVPPRDPEEFRDRIRLLTTALAFLKIRHPISTA